MKNVQTAISKAEKLYADGDKQGAKDLLISLSSESPENLEIMNNLGAIEFEEGNIEKALEYLGKVLAVEPTHKAAALNYIQILISTGHQSTALEFLNALLVHHPNDSTLLEAQKSLTAPAKKPIPELTSAAFDVDPEKRKSELVRVAQLQLEQGLIEESRVNLERICYMTRYQDEEAKNKLIEIYKHQQDIPALMKLWKRIAVSALERKNLDLFLTASYLSIYSETLYSKNPSYKFANIDWDLNTFCKFATEQHPVSTWIERNRKKKKKKQKQKPRIRVGFVLEGFSNKQAPTRSYFPIAEHHDPEQFELYFYSRWSHETPLAKAENFELYVNTVENWGCKARHPSSPLSPTKEVEFLAKAIIGDEIDVLVFQTTYFVPVYNMLAHLRPAKKLCSVVHQQSEFHPQIDLVFIEGKLRTESASKAGINLLCKTREVAAPHSRSSLGIPEDAVVATSVNRPMRYAQPKFWEELLKLMERHPNLWFLGIGLESADEFIQPNSNLSKRIVACGFKTDVMEHLGAADFYLDIFPSGGGSSVIEAMQCGLPSLCFQNDLTCHYKLSDETFAADWMGDEELIISHKRYDLWQQTADRLITDATWRAQKSQSMVERVERYDEKEMTHRFLDTAKELYAKA